ncbi:MAG: sugar phosphate nucleotidyltransferase [Thermoanaerobaculia bacterium]
MILPEFVRKAVIPAVGYGTRMQPFSLLIPKELAPLGSRPAIHWVIEEAVTAGIGDIAIVIREDKLLIQKYLDAVQKNGEFDGVSFHYPRQTSGHGLAEAISAGRDFAGTDPFALLLPDNLFLSPSYTLARLLEVASATKSDVLGVLALDGRHDCHYGNSGRIDSTLLESEHLQITRLYDKKPGRLRIGPEETLYRVCGRAVCQPHIFEFIDRVRPGIRGEFDEVPVFQEIIGTLGAHGCILPLPLFDVGHPNGLLAASAYLHRQQHKDR